MGVYIREMKMPSGCIDCPLAVLANGFRCGANEKNYGEAFGLIQRREDCPLVEVPVPHGRLIDAHEVRTRMIGFSFSVQTWISEVELSNVPTVIEREEE